MNVRDRVWDMVEENPEITLDEVLSKFDDPREKGWAEAGWHYRVKQPRNEHGADIQSPTYYPAIDPEIRELCRVINDHFPGIRTTGGCCGHGGQPLMIFLEVDEGNHKGLFMLARCADRRYWKHGHEWKLEIEVCDIPYNPLPITYVLRSEAKGEPAFEQAEDLLENIEWHRRHVNFLRGYALEELALPGVLEEAA